MDKPSAAELKKKLEKARGNISAVARAYGRSRSTIYTWINSHETVKGAWKDQREMMVDDVEDRLFKRAIIDENDQSMFYVLNNMKEARERGWGVRQHEITGKDGAPIPITYIKENRPDDD